MDRDTNPEGNQSAEAIAATQQVGDELPSGIRTGRRSGASMDDPRPEGTRTGAINPDDPDPTNTAAGVSVGGTGAGIEPAVDAELGLEDPSELDERVAEVYDEPAADVDFDRTAG